MRALHRKGSSPEGFAMFPYNDPQTMLDLHHQRAGELARRAASVRLAREAGPPRRRGRWPRLTRRAAVAA